MGAGPHSLSLTRPNLRLATRFAVGLALTPAMSAAQSRMQQDTATSQLVFSDVFLGRRAAPAFVVLVAGTAYRVEVEPAAGAVSIRPRNLTQLPALTLRSMENPSGPAGGASYLIVPSATAEYRIDVVTGDEPVRVRIVRDAREQRLLAGQAEGRLGVITTGVRAAYLGKVQSPYRTTSGATGAAGCLGLAPGRLPRVPRWLTGCMFTISAYGLDDGGRLTLGGLSPRFEVARRGPLSLAIAANVDITGKATYPGRNSVTYQSFGAGVNAGWRFVPRIHVEAEAGLTHLIRNSYRAIDQVGGGGQVTVPAQGATVSRLAAGVHLRL